MVGTALMLLLVSVLGMDDDRPMGIGTSRCWECGSFGNVLVAVYIGLEVVGSADIE